MEWVDSVLFDKNNNFLLAPAPGRGGRRVEAVHYLAQLDPGAGHRPGLLQPGQSQEVLEESSPQPRFSRFDSGF